MIKFIKGFPLFYKKNKKILEISKVTCYHVK